MLPPSPSRSLLAVIHPVHEIAAEVIRQTGKDKPANATWREILKSLRSLAPVDAQEKLFPGLGRIVLFDFLQKLASGLEDFIQAVSGQQINPARERFSFYQFFGELA